MRLLASLVALLCLSASHATATEEDKREPAEAWGATPFRGEDSGPTSHTAFEDKYVVFHRPWYHNDRFYAVSGPASPPLPPRSRDAGSKVKLLDLPLTQPDQLHSLVEAHWLSGVALLVDFAFPTAATNMASWAEVMLPLFCALASAEWRVATGHQTVATLVLPSYDREEVQALGWVWDMWQVVLSPTGQAAAPRFLFRDDLNAVSRRHWLCFEALLSAHDRYSNPALQPGFWSSKLGAAFRAAAYRLQGLQLPEQLPPTITLLDGPSDEAGIANQAALLEHLWDAANAFGLRVRPFSATTEAPLASFLGAMGRTGVLVARHGSLLTNAIFLPPGALVLELLPFHWEWNGFSRQTKNLTASLADVHHTAWRARSPRNVAFAAADDARFADWATQECITAECVTVHGSAPVIADCAAVRELLYRTLPSVLAGQSVAEAAVPWPPVEPELATSLFHWQR